MDNIFKKKKNIDFQSDSYQENGEPNTREDVNKSADSDFANFKADIKSYNDPEGLTVRKMSIGLWLVANRKNFRIILTGFLLLIIFITWGNFIFTFGRHVFFGIKQDQKLFSEMLLYNQDLFNYLQSKPLKNLIFSDAESIKIEEGRYDFYIKISNPNEKYWAHFDYVFLAGNTKTRQASGFILPNETKYIVLLGADIENAGGNPSLKIEQMNWQEVDYHTFKDWEKFAAYHLKINTDNIRYTPAQASNLSEKISINSLDFSATNNTAYNYWDIAFVALLFNDNRIIGVNRYAANRFLSGQTQNISITWPENIGRVSNTMVIPEIDITRDDIYIQFDGGTGTSK